MKLGLVLPQLGPHATATAIREFAVRADELGYDSLWVQEHLFFPARHTTGYAGVKGLPMPDEYRYLLAPLESLAFVDLSGLTEPPVAGLGRPLWQGRAEDMAGALQRSKADGCDEVVVDCTFTRGLGGEAGWVAQPEFFLPLLEEAHR